MKSFINRIIRKHSSGKKIPKIEELEAVLDPKNPRLNVLGGEVLDPIPHSATLDIKPRPSLEERMKRMVNFENYKNSGQYARDMFPDDDTSGDPDPEFDFERLHREKAEAYAAYLEIVDEVNEAERERRFARKEAATRRHLEEMVARKKKIADALKQTSTNSEGNREEASGSAQGSKK